MEEKGEEAGQAPQEHRAPEERQQLMAGGDIQAHRGKQAPRAQTDLQAPWDLRALRALEESLV